MDRPDISLKIPNKKLDPEEEYFARQEMEKLRRFQKETASKLAAEERDRLKELHYMKCPKCGMDMKEIDFQALVLDKCFSCGGIYFDAGELDTLIDKQKAGVFVSIKNFFG
jgi:hypothetical protein